MICKNAYFVQKYNFLLVGPTSSVQFFGHNGATYSTYRLRAVVSLKFLAIENMTPHGSAHVYYGKTAGWIRIPLDTKLGIGPGDIVLDGDPAPPGKGVQQPHF